MFGEVWYAEADSPTGPWGKAVKVLSHNNYTFYNPRLHAELTPSKSPLLLFEGTYTQTFADRPLPTPRYDYNQILYRLDLDDWRCVGRKGRKQGRAGIGDWSAELLSLCGSRETLARVPHSPNATSGLGMPVAYILKT